MSLLLNLPPLPGTPHIENSGTFAVDFAVGRQDRHNINVRTGRHVKLLPELWRGGYRATHSTPSDREAGGQHNDYEQVTQDIREGLSIVAANKGDKSVEIIMKEILEVLTAACEQHNIDKFEFIQAFYEWYKEKRN